MAEFARNFFGGFGAFHKNSANSSTNSNSARSSEEPSTDSTTITTAAPQPQDYSRSTISGQETTHSSATTPGRITPAAPTISLSDPSVIFHPDGAALSRPVAQFPSHATTTLTAPLAPQSTQEILTNPQSSEAGSKQSVTSLGKLSVRIIEAKDLHIASQISSPYVVCTFESSETISHGPTASADSSASSAAPRAPVMAIPMRSKQASSLNLAIQARESDNNINNCATGVTNSLNNLGSATNPTWKHEAIFDVISTNSELDISIYDAKLDETFLGHVSIRPDFVPGAICNSWHTLEARVPGENVSGAIRVEYCYTPRSQKHHGPEDFEILRLLGKGTFGQVYQVRKKDTQRVYAMKVLSKKVIVRKKEVAHTIGERNILVRTALTDSPFIVGLKFSFQTPSDLYLVTDFMSGGELFWHLQKEGRFTEDRAKFYIAELVVALEHLHDNGIVYRDLKPENILLDANGHIALCDFGLSKANLNTEDGVTHTFCGTTEYLAPEVLLDEEGYTKMVDFWSLGVLIFEMCCGWSPFYADNTQQMYKNIAFGKVRFPKEVLSPEGRSFVKGLLNRNPKHRLGAVGDARELKAHPFFHDINWDLLIQKKIPPPFKPHLSSELDTSNFDPEFTNTSSSVINSNFLMDSTPLSPGMQDKFKGFTYVDESSINDHFKNFASSYRPRIDLENSKDREEAVEDEEDEDVGMTDGMETGERHDEDLVFGDGGIGAINQEEESGLPMGMGIDMMLKDQMDIDEYRRY